MDGGGNDWKDRWWKTKGAGKEAENGHQRGPHFAKKGPNFAKKGTHYGLRCWNWEEKGGLNLFYRKENMETILANAKD